MKKNLSIKINKQIQILFVVFIVSCASTHISQPNWVTDYKYLYPESEYIVQRGSGATADEAKHYAVQAIAEYMSSQIHSKRIVNLKNVQYDDNIINEKYIENQIDVISDIEILGLEYTEPWKHRQTGTWYCVAYINRETAWKIYEPKIRVKRNKFYAFYQKAQEEQEPFFKIHYYGEAKKSGKTFIDSLSYAQMLSEKLTDEKYKNDIIFLSRISVLQEQVKQECPIYISIKDDESDIVYASINKTLSENGFVITKNKIQSIYIAEVDLEHNLNQINSVFFITPSATVSIKGNNGTVYSFTTNANRVSGLNESIVKIKACENVANVIRNQLAEDLNVNLGIE